MNIEKVKEALEHLKHLMQQPDDFMFTAKYLREHFSEAIAELEKPADRDAFDCALRVLAFNPSTTNATGKLADMIHQYAESYHAKKCAECIGNLPAFPHRPSRFPETRSGITTDVDK